MASTYDPFAEAAAKLKQRIEAQDEKLSAKRLEDARKHLGRIVDDFVIGLRSSWIAVTRDPRSSNHLLQNSVDDLLESVSAVPILAGNGIFNPARRELRFLLEAAVKYIYVDQEVSAAAPLDERLRYLGDTRRVPRSSIAPTDALKIRLLDDPKPFRDAVTSAFGALSGYIHPAQPTIEMRLRRAQPGGTHWL